MKKPILIVQCEIMADNSPSLCALAGDTDDLFRSALDAGDYPVEVVRVCRDEPLPSFDRFAAIMISGSSAMVADSDPWIARTAAWVGQAHQHGVPTLGVCFGHQLIAHALGGVVSQTPNSVEFSTVAIDRADPDQGDPLLGYLPQRFVAQAAHFQTVVKPPPDSKILARNSSGIQALRFGPSTWGIQFHPEFNETHTSLILDYINNPVHRGVDVETGRAHIRPSPEAAVLFSRFRDLVLGQS